MKKLTALFAATIFLATACQNENSSTVGYYEEPTKTEHVEKAEHGEGKEAMKEPHNEEASKPAATDTTGKMRSDTTSVHEGH